MGEYKGMADDKRIEITIDSSIGQCALTFKAILSDVQKAAKLAGDNLLFHKAATKAYSESKKNNPSGFDRKTAYSAELGLHCAKIVRESFAGVFDIEGEIATSAAEAPLSDFDRYAKTAKAVGFSDEEIKTSWEKAQARKAAEKPAEAKADAQPEEEVESLK